MNNAFASTSASTLLRDTGIHDTQRRLHDSDDAVVWRQSHVKWTQSIWIASCVIRRLDGGQSTRTPSVYVRDGEMHFVSRYEIHAKCTRSYFVCRIFDAARCVLFHTAKLSLLRGRRKRSYRWEMSCVRITILARCAIQVIVGKRKIAFGFFSRVNSSVFVLSSSSLSLTSRVHFVSSSSSFIVNFLHQF